MPIRFAKLIFLLPFLVLFSCSDASKIQVERSSGIIKKNFDHSINPQDNFYQFVNGQWLATVQIPTDKSAVGTFYDVHERAQRDIVEIISQLINQTPQQLSHEEQLVANFYHSYIDTDTRNAIGLSPLKSIFDDINNLKNKSELASFFGKYQNIGIKSPAVLYVSADAKNPTHNALHLWQSGLSLPTAKYYTADNKRYESIQKHFNDHINKILSLAKLADGTQIAKDVIAIENEIAKIHWSTAELRDSEKRYTSLTPAQLSDLTPAFNWQHFLNAQGLTNVDKIIVNQVSYIESLNKVISNFSLKQWQSYLTFHAVNRFASFLTTDLAAQNHTFYKKQLKGIKGRKSLSARGVSVVNSYFSDALGKIYVAKYFDQSAKSRMENMVQELIKAYFELVQEADWLSQETQKEALAKITNIRAKIGYPNVWQDYSALKTKPDDLIGNLVNIQKYHHKIELEKVSQQVDHEQWIMPAQSVNAYYNPTANEIAFPAAILQPPFFTLNADEAINYGAIGSVIGHELAHVLDKQGGKFDAQGKLRTWWTKEDLAAFDSRTKNLINQYNAYQVTKDQYIKGDLTLGENLGDLVGLEIAFRAFENRSKQKPFPSLDGYSAKQRFFIGFAQIWRTKATEKMLANQLSMSAYSPSEYRVLGALSNFEAFYQAFSVTPSHKMYLLPEKRVKIWVK